MSNKLRYSLISLLILGTIILTTQYLEFGMMGITAFILAYLSKGMRRIK